MVFFRACVCVCVCVCDRNKIKYILIIADAIIYQSRNS